MDDDVGVVVKGRGLEKGMLAAGVTSSDEPATRIRSQPRASSVAWFSTRMGNCSPKRMTLGFSTPPHSQWGIAPSRRDCSIAGSTGIFL